MKKSVKLLSVLLLVSMLFSITAASASAIVNDGSSSGGTVIIGGSGEVNTNSSGNLVIGADMRPEDDSPYTGVRVEDLPSYDSQIESARTSNKTGLEAAAMEEAKKYLAQADSDYSGIVDSEFPLVQANQDFLMYIRDHLDEVDTATLQTALDLFGEEAVYGKASDAEFDVNAAEADLDELDAQLTALEEAYKAENPDAEGFDDLKENNPEYAALLDQFDALSLAVDMMQTEGDALLAPVPVADITPRFYEVVTGGSSLASAVSGGGTVVFNTGKSFDICNSSDYRITVDLHGATIDARACDAAFTIRANGGAAFGAYRNRGGTITFTNGTIIGDGFYVTGGGVLNLGGLINAALIDITVYAESNAVYVDDGLAVIGQGTTLNGWLQGNDPNKAAFTVDVTKMPVYALGSTVYATSPNASVKMTGGTISGGFGAGVAVRDGASFEMSSSVCEVLNNLGLPAVYMDGPSTVQIHGGYIYGGTGIVANTASGTLTINGGAITGFLKNIGYDAGTGTYFTGFSGAAVEVNGDAINVGGNSAATYINGGTLRSEYSAGVVNIKADGTRPTAAERAQIKRITVDDVNVTIQQKSGEISDYAKSIYLVTGLLTAGGTSVTSGYGTLADACNAANTLFGAVTIKMIDDDKMCDTSGDINPANADSVLFDGNGHTIKTTSGVDGIIVDSGNVTIRNVSIDGTHSLATSGIQVNDGVVYIGPSVSVGHYTNGLYVTGGVVTVNGFDVESHTDIGICVDDSTTVSQVTVVMCKVDSDAPVDGSGITDPDSFFVISGGWFLHKEDIYAPNDTTRKVATYVDPDISFVKYVEKDRYYEVLYNDTPTVEIKSGATGYESDGKTPYVMYDKANPDPIIFTITPGVNEIIAIYNNEKTGEYKEYPIFSAQSEKGKSGDIRIPDSAVLRDCPAGRYDLEFRFANGYVLKDKLHFYVFPKYAGLFTVPNIEELSPSYDLFQTGVPFNNGKIVEYLIDKNKTDTYNVTSEKNIVVVMSELPDKITIGNIPDGSREMLLENYDNDANGVGGDPASPWTLLGFVDQTWGIVPSGQYQGYYFYFISYADLNNLPVGQNYVFLGWNGIDGALKRLPLTVKNAGVSISPEKLDWSKIDSYANFTVKPSVDTVYIDGNKVEDSYWTYDKDTHVLSIKGSYLNALTSKEHMVEVITPNGKVSASLNTGVGLRAKGVDYHVYGGARALSFVASDKINKEAGIWIGSSNPTRLDQSAYTWDGETGFTLNAAFLNRLALGTYYISAYVYNGTEYQYTTTTFKVISASQASYNPSTGDNSNIFIWVAVLALSGVAIVVILLPRLKKGKMK